jgi:NAD(P)-dependent dehydrogenase (short-subunit alcohol dehydrogenase family)
MIVLLCSPTFRTERSKTNRRSHQMSEKLAEKVAVVTGGTSGIGLAIATRFVAEGATVYVSGRRQEAIDEALSKIDGDATGVRADASDADDLARLFETVREGSGHLDVLVANAGGGSFAPLGEITEEQYHDTFDASVKGTLLTVQST